MGFGAKKPSLSDAEEEERRKTREAQEALQAKAEADRITEAQAANAQRTRDLQQRRGFRSLLSAGGDKLGQGGKV
jgi:hypothetical protein